MLVIVYVLPKWLTFSGITTSPVARWPSKCPTTFAQSVGSSYEYIKGKDDSSSKTAFMFLLKPTAKEKGLEVETTLPFSVQYKNTYSGEGAAVKVQTSPFRYVPCLVTRPPSEGLGATSMDEVGCEERTKRTECLQDE